MKLLTKYGDYVEESISFSPQSKIMLTIGIIIEYFPSVILGFLSTSNLRIYFTNNEISLNDYTESYYFKVSLIPYIISNISDENRSLTIIILVLSLALTTCKSVDGVPFGVANTPFETNLLYGLFISSAE